MLLVNDMGLKSHDLVQLATRVEVLVQQVGLQPHIQNHLRLCLKGEGPDEVFPIEQRNS